MSKRRFFTILLSTAAMLVTLHAVVAHEFWIWASKFYLRKGDSVSVSIFNGEDFSGQKIEFKPERIAAFSQFTKNGKTDLLKSLPEAGKDPAISIEDEGTLVLAYESKGKFIELEAEKFTRYLQEEGLDEIVELRKQRNQAGSAGRELFFRCAKAVLQAGSRRDKTYQQNCGMRLELLPNDNPYSLKAGEKLSVKVLFDGKPVSNALVQFWNNSGGRQMRIKVRTDDAGEAAVKLHESGVWMASCVKMVAHPDAKEADWASFWGSVTFEIAK